MSETRKRRSNPRLCDVAAKLRIEWLELLEDGLGYELMSEKSREEKVEALEEVVQRVFMAYARKELCGSIGVSVAEAMDVAPEEGEEGGED